MKSRKPKKRVPIAWRFARQMWTQIRPDRCVDVEKTIQHMATSLVNCSIPAPLTMLDVVEQITRTTSIPINIESVSEKLAAHKISRGPTLFGSLGDALDDIAMNYPNMYWWVSDKGLNMEIIEPSYVLADRFDELAGTLMIQKLKDGRLSTQSLLEIAAELDNNNFHLKENLQRKEWEEIAHHNQKRARAPIKTFVEAANHKRLSRFVRRSLYRARDQKTRALSPRLSVPYFGIYA